MTVLEMVLIPTNIAALYGVIGYYKLYKNLKEEIKIRKGIEQNDKEYIKKLEKQIYLLKSKP